MFLFFDIESTGLSTRKDHLVQLAWILADENEKIIEQGDYIVKPDGYKIPKRSTEVHGITTANAFESGLDLPIILDKFAATAKKADAIVAHNLLGFDYPLLESTYKRAGKDFPLLGKIQIDTMRLSTQWCRLPNLNGKKGFKWPSLDELHYRLFGEGFDNAHDAMADTKAMMKSYYELINKGVITPQNIAHSQQDRPHTHSQEDNFNNQYKTGYSEGFLSGFEEGKKYPLYNTSLETLANSDNAYDRLFVSKHPKAENKILHQLLTDEVLEVRCEIAKRINFTPLLFINLLVKESILKFDSNDESYCEKLTALESSEYFIQLFWDYHWNLPRPLIVSLAMNPNLDDEMFYTLYYHSTSEEDRREIESNKRFDVKEYANYLTDTLSGINGLFDWYPVSTEKYCTETVLEQMLHKISLEHEIEDEIANDISDYTEAPSVFSAIDNIIHHPNANKNILIQATKVFYSGLHGRDFSNKETINWVINDGDEIKHHPIPSDVNTVFKIHEMFTNTISTPAQVVKEAQYWMGHFKITSIAPSGFKPNHA